MTPHPVCVSRRTPLAEALRLVDEHDFGFLPVMERGELLGVVSDRDLLVATGWRAPGPLPRRKDGEELECVGQITDSTVPVIEPGASVEAAAAAFLRSGSGCLLVLGDETLLGIVTEVDLLEYFATRDDWQQSRGERPVRDHMTHAPAPIYWYRSLRDAITICRYRAARRLAVMEAGRFVGFITDRDLRRAVAAGRDEEMPLDGFVRTDRTPVEPDTLLVDAARLMVQRRSVLSVIDHDELVGVVTPLSALGLDAFRRRERASGSGADEKRGTMKP